MIAEGGWTVHRFATVDSTQHIAADVIARGAAHRTAVVADRQTAGYGRKGDRWLDAPGDSLLMTLILRPQLGDAGVANGIIHYPMAASLAALEAVRETAGAHGAIKWPNDLLLGGRKVGGVLGDATWARGRLDALRIGIGINIRASRDAFAMRGLPDATSVAAETGCDLDRDTLLRVLLRRFATYDDVLLQGNGGEIVSAWRAATATIGEAIIATLLDGRGVHGTAIGVTDEGDLLVADDTGTITQLSAPAVRSLRPLSTERMTDRSP